MDTYVIRFRLEGNAWVVTYQGLELATWGRTLTQARQAAKEALAVHLGLDSVEALEAAVQMEEDVQLPASLGDTAKTLRARRQALEAESAALAEQTATAVAKLSAQGLSVRDIGAALGVSPQRVSQLTTKRKPSNRRESTSVG